MLGPSYKDKFNEFNLQGRMQAALLAMSTQASGAISQTGDSNLCHVMDLTTHRQAVPCRARGMAPQLQRQFKKWQQGSAQGYVGHTRHESSPTEAAVKLTETLSQQVRTKNSGGATTWRGLNPASSLLNMGAAKSSVLKSESTFHVIKKDFPTTYLMPTVSQKLPSA